jgi:hypothetical protein
MTVSTYAISKNVDNKCKLRATFYKVGRFSFNLLILIRKNDFFRKRYSDISDKPYAKDADDSAEIKSILQKMQGC